MMPWIMVGVSDDFTTESRKRDLTMALDETMSCEQAGVRFGQMWTGNVNVHCVHRTWAAGSSDRDRAGCTWTLEGG